MLDQSIVHILLGNNDLPPEIVIQDVQRCLREAEAVLLGIETQIKELQQQADAIKPIIAQYTTILSPIRVMPDDVLREIFARTMQFDPEGTTSSHRERQAPPMVLTRVCQRWREVALSTPALWCQILITIPSAINPENSVSMKAMATEAIPRQHRLMIQEVDRMRRWFKRAGILPLSISIKGGKLYTPNSWVHELGDLNPDFIEKLSWMFNVISTYLPQCESLLFSFPDDRIYDLFDAHVTAEKVKRIKYFKPDIHIPYRSDSQYKEKVIQSTLFRLLPSLRDLHLLASMVFALPYTKSSGPHTWKGITHLVVDDYISILHAAFIFEQCPCLIDLRLCISESIWEPPMTSWSLANATQSTKEIFVPGLRCLKLSIDVFQPRQSDEVQSLLPFYRLFTPHLQFLQYTIQNAYVEWLDWHEIVSHRDLTAHLRLDHILSSSESLNHVVVNGRKLMDEDSISVIRELSLRCTHLSIQGDKNQIGLLYIYQQYLDSGYEFASETDSAFEHLFTLPEWCKSAPLAAPIPLTEVEGFDISQLNQDLEDQPLPLLERLDLSTLQSVRSNSLLAFIVYRLRLYEYAIHKSGPNEKLNLKPLKHLTARVLGQSTHDLDISETVQKLAAAIGISFKLEVEYPEDTSNYRSNSWTWSGWH